MTCRVGDRNMCYRSHRIYRFLETALERGKILIDCPAFLKDSYMSRRFVSISCERTRPILVSEHVSFIIVSKGVRAKLHKISLLA